MTLLTPSILWEATDDELKQLINEAQREVNFRAICNSQPLPYTLDYDTPMATEIYGG
jgi:hypothetical protein